MWGGVLAVNGYLQSHYAKYIHDAPVIHFWLLAVVFHIFSVTAACLLLWHKGIPLPHFGHEDAVKGCTLGVQARAIVTCTLITSPIVLLLDPITAQEFLIAGGSLICIWSGNRELMAQLHGH